MSTKQEARIKQLRYLKNFTGSVRDFANRQIFSSLIKNEYIHNAHTICSFISYQHEVDTHRFIEWCLEQQKVVVAPRVEQNNLELYRLNTFTECLPGSKHILEPPSSNQKVDPLTTDVFIVPGLAFDMECFRIGYGKGYYDRLLSTTNGYKIGICFTNQVMFSLPRDPHDIPLNRIITDTIQISKN